MLLLFFLMGAFWGCDLKGKDSPRPQTVTQKVAPEKAPDSMDQKPMAAATQPPAPGMEGPRPPADQSSNVQPEQTLSGAMLTPDQPIKEADDPGKLSYDPKGKIDPFEPLFQEEPVQRVEKKKKTQKGPLTPLEKVDLSQLKLTGVIVAKSGNRALIKEASGKGYIVKIGTPIGINSGRIVQIHKDRVVVEEEIEDVMGNVSMQKKEMTLQKPPGE